LKKSTIHLTSEGDQKYGIEFKFDSDTECYLSVYFTSKESIENGCFV